MSRFTVVWTESAISELADCWLDAPDREAIRISADNIDKLLGQDFEGKGEDLSEGLFRADVSSLRVLYTFDTDDRIVRIEAVRPL